VSPVLPPAPQPTAPATVTPSSLPAPEPSAQPSPAPSLKVDLDQDEGFSSEGVVTLVQATALMQQVMNTDCFRQGIESASMTETQGMDSDQVYAVIMSGQTFWKGADGVMDLLVQYYYDWFSRTIGYVETGDKWIYVNGKYFTSPLYIGSLLAHEYSHQEGFTHYGVLATSVPYTINRVFESCASPVDRSQDLPLDLVDGT
jgi:hypothetical protein